MGELRLWQHGCIQKAAKAVGLPMKFHSNAKKLAGALIREDLPLPEP